MKKLIAIALAAFGLASFGEYARIDLTGEQDVTLGAAKVEALSVASTDSDAEVTVKSVRIVRSFTNAQSIASSAITNVVASPNRLGVYSSGFDVFTNTTGNVFVRRGGSDQLSWSHVTNTVYRFIYTNETLVATNWVNTTNTVYVGGRSFDYTYLQLPPTITTNIVTTAVTSTWPVIKATVFLTNTLGSVTCSGGKATLFPTNAFISGGEKLVTTGLSVEGESVEAKLIIVK